MAGHQPPLMFFFFLNRFFYFKNSSYSSDGSYCILKFKSFFKKPQQSDGIKQSPGRCSAFTGSALRGHGLTNLDHSPPTLCRVPALFRRLGKESISVQLEEVLKTTRAAELWPKVNAVIPYSKQGQPFQFWFCSPFPRKHPM